MFATRAANINSRPNTPPRHTQRFKGSNGVAGPAPFLFTTQNGAPHARPHRRQRCAATMRYHHGAAALDGKLYAMGGWDAGDNKLAKAEVYDPRVDGWQPLPSMPTARRDLAAVAVAGKVYAIGGTSDGSPEDSDGSVEAYDPFSGLWSQAASLPVARDYHTAAVVDGKIYVVGGLIYDYDDGDGVDLDRVDMYDPAADSWQPMAEMPTARSSHAAAIVDGKIYVSGGSTSGEYSDALEAYDPVTNTWATLASLSHARSCHASAVINGQLYVFGGFGAASSGSGRLDLVEVYSPASNTWRSAADLPLPIAESVAVAL